MHFDRRQFGGAERVTDRHRRVAVGRRIDDDARAVTAGGLDRVDQHALVVALHGADLEAETGGHLGHPLLDLSQGGGSVDLGLTGAEHVEIRPVDEQ